MLEQLNPSSPRSTGRLLLSSRRRVEHRVTEDLSFLHSVISTEYEYTLNPLFHPSLNLIVDRDWNKWSRSATDEDREKVIRV